MRCNNPNEAFATLKYYIDMNNIQQKDIAMKLDKKPQYISSVFKSRTCSLSFFFELLDCLDLNMDIHPKDLH